MRESNVMRRETNARRFYLVLFSLPCFVLTTIKKLLSAYSTNPSMAIIEAISWPNGGVSCGSVNVMIANLYYGKSVSGEIRCLIGAEDSPGYHFESIEVLMSNATSVYAIYSVNVSEYSMRENGILLQDASKVNASDFKLSYTFDLSTIFDTSKDIKEDVCFSVRYKEKMASDESRIFEKRFYTNIEILHGLISLTDFRFDNF